MLDTTQSRTDATEAIRCLMAPRSVAFVGASTSIEKPSGQPIRNVTKVGFTGEVHAINARGEAIDGRPTLRSIDAIPGQVDVGFVTVPAPQCAAAIRALGAKGAHVAVVAVGGFAELGTEAGRQLTADLIQAGRESGVRLVGPVCNGLYSTPNQLALGYNAIHTRRLKPGRVALVSHSGALVAPFVTVLEGCDAGLSRYVGTGSEADLGMSDFVAFLADDPETSVIALILDHVGDGEAFRRAVRRARANGKDIVALKLGNSSLGRDATLAHSSHLSGTQHVYDAVFAAEGIRQVPTLETLALTCAILSSGRRRDAGGLVACSTSGGGAILLADLTSQTLPAGKVTALDAATVERIGGQLRFDAATIMNPFDLGLGGRHHYAANIEALALDPGAAVLLVYGTPMATQQKREQLANSVVGATKARPDLPVLYLTPAPLMEDERAILGAARVPVCASTLDAVAVAAALLPVAPPRDLPEHSTTAQPTEGSGPLPEHRSKAFLRARGVDFPEEVLAADLAAVRAAASRLGYPVVLKASGPGIWHKSELGLVRVNLRDEAALDAAFASMQASLKAHPDLTCEGFLVGTMVTGGVEAILGISRDPEFGPVLLFGPGGVMAELFGATAMRHLPLPADAAAIRSALQGSPLGTLLAGFRGEGACDTEAFVALAEKVAGIAASLGQGLAELDLNPVKVGPAGTGAWPLDALVVLADAQA